MMHAESCLKRKGEVPQHIAFRVRHHYVYLSMYLIGFALLLIGIALLAHYVDDSTTSIDHWVESMGRWAPVIFVLGAALLCILFIPQAITGVAGGMLFPIGWGLLYVVLSELLAATISFFLGRHFFRGYVKGLLSKHPRLGIFDRATPARRFRLMFLMRLAPANFSLLNYICSVSGVRFWRYLLAVLGVLPGNLCTVYAGNVAKHIGRRVTGHESYPLMHYVLMIGGLVLAVFVVFFIARMAFRMAKEDCPQADSCGVS